MEHETVVAAPTVDQLADGGSGCSPVSPEAPVACGAWTRDIEALCRALDAQQRAHFPRTDEKDQ